ncbi:sensor histidine kinase [Gracilinema caldarium]|uniref:histidine kinase n=1 Tax=Gracilinema caldarium (strain ATCC 51460 / DSM 7334 / H1) TaxID=744872 RepID=F8EY19_GRAC1|nr:ATP-binding protein [Gracilinema caldarium]AEJ20680.1 integral membrane sensor signal transduction histidine kinase [Gracilinema caldarium DSM 7334]
MSRFDAQQRTTTLTIPALFFIYTIVGILVLVFSSNLFTQYVQQQSFSFSLFIIVFTLISLVLTLFLAVALFRLIRDIVQKRSGSRLKLNLFSYFFILTLLISVPTIFVHIQLISNLLSTWNQANIAAIVEDAHLFALDSYSYRLALIQRIAESEEISLVLQQRLKISEVDPALLALQEFQQDQKGLYHTSRSVGNEAFFLNSLPGTEKGFVPRNEGRDQSCIRYIVPQQYGRLILITFSLGHEFDEKLARIEAGQDIIRILSQLESRLVSLLGGFYMVLYLPILLMVMIIAISLSDSLSQPISNLVQATRKVAEGDLSIRVICTTHDDIGTLIDSFNTMVRNLEKAQSRALQTEKENIWKDMSQRLAHEIKNPLTPIKLSAERVLRRWKTDPKRLGEILEESMLAIIQETDGLTNLLTEFRTFSRLPPPVLERTALQPLLEEALNLYRTSYPDIQFIINTIPPNTYLRVDRRHINQVLANLIINSIDAMHGRGIIEIQTDLVKKTDCRYCRISIRDNGCGIPEEHRSLIFTPYFTTKATGTGLGLSIVERIVLDHGGTIWFDSAIGVGTTFFIDLPVDSTGS